MIKLKINKRTYIQTQNQLIKIYRAIIMKDQGIYEANMAQTITFIIWMVDTTSFWGGTHYGEMCDNGDL